MRNSPKVIKAIKLDVEANKAWIKIQQELKEDKSSETYKIGSAIKNHQKR